MSVDITRIRNNTKIGLIVQGVAIPLVSATAVLTTGANPVDLIQQNNAFWNLLPKRYSVTFSTIQIRLNNAPSLGTFLWDLQEAQEPVPVSFNPISDDGAWTFTSLDFGNGLIVSGTYGPFEPNVVPLITTTMNFLSASRNSGT